MTRTTLARLARLGRWPRRVAALLCLLLAALSALSAQHPQPASARHADAQHPPAATARLQRGQLAVPVTVSDDASAYLRVGDQVDLFATPDSTARGEPAPAALVGEGLSILALPAASTDTQGTGVTHMIVAADRQTAARLAGLAGYGVLAVLAKYP